MSYDVMIDIETLSTEDDALVISIGAVAFDVSAAQFWVVAEGLWRVRFTDRNLGRIDAKTVLWWMSQSAEAQKELTEVEGRIPLKQALSELRNFCANADGVWSNGPMLDERILRCAERAVGHDPAGLFSYKKSRCCRTIYDIGRRLGIQLKDPEGVVAHNPLHDARRQASHMQQIVSQLWKG
jgi:hypothetical protein